MVLPILIRGLLLMSIPCLLYTSDGNYAINVPAGAKLKFSYIGYKDQIIDVAAQTVINVKLQERCV